MMTKLREYSKIGIVILALAFIGLMVFDWGMDYLGLRQRSNVVGKVNGQRLTYEMFSKSYQQMYQTERQRNSDRELKEEQLEAIREQVWEQFVQKVLFEAEMSKLKITVSDSEIVYQIKNYPLEQIRNSPGFQTDGRFDWNKYYASFSNPEIPWYQIEDFYRQQLPYVKLQNIITSSVRVSDSETEQEFTDNYLKANVTYLEILFKKFRISDVPVSADAVKDYYDEHRDEYKQEETRNLDYVSFALTPTKNDTDAILREFDEIRTRLAAGEDFNKLADENSDDPDKATNHGKLDFFERGTMFRSFDEVLFASKTGEVIGPLEDQDGFHLIRIDDKRLQDGKEQVKVSQILRKVSCSPSTREYVESMAAQFRNDAGEEGFETVAGKNKYSIQQTGDITQTSKFIPGFGRNYQIYNFAFKNKIGEISEPVYSEQSVAVFKLSRIKEAGIRPLEDVKTLITASIRLEKQKERAREFSKLIQAKIDQSISFEQIVMNDTSKTMRIGTTGDFSMKSSIPGIGFDQKFNAIAFSLTPGQISPMTETFGGIYWQSLLSKSGFDSTLYNSQKESIRQRLFAQKRNQVFNNWYTYLKEKADIEDNRNMFNL
jgi:peptidyl-prolyl cis-trans isomerase D